MNADSCGKGLVIFSITLVLGIGIASLSLPEKQTTSNSEQPKSSKQSKQICVKQDTYFEAYEDGKMVLIPCEIDDEIYFSEPANDSREIIENIEKNKNEAEKLKSRLKNKKY
jgi:hypothetical protein